MENASGKTKSVLESVKNTLKAILARPQSFFFSKPFALIYVPHPQTLSSTQADPYR